MTTPKLYALIYVHTNIGQKLALVGKVGRKQIHLLMTFPDIRIRRLPLADLRWQPAPPESIYPKGQPGRRYRRLARRHGISKAAKAMLRGAA